MFSQIKVRVGLFGLLLLLIALVAFTGQALPNPPVFGNGVIKEATFTTVANSTFYTIRPDMRKCASPMCGGYFVKQVNQSLTRCANGRNMSECYVVSIEWDGASEVEPKRALIRGSLLTRGNRNGKYGVLKAIEVWKASSDGKPVGEFYRLTDLHIRCVTAPCEATREAKLNSALERKVAGVSWPSTEESSAQLNAALKAMGTQDGVIVVGSHVDVTGPGGRSQTLKATQFYVRTSSSSALKPCIKTGCSKQICSDEEVITTCEYRTEYECYQKATCERQADGNCGFTKTPELQSCLARKRSG